MSSSLVLLSVVGQLLGVTAAPHAYQSRSLPSAVVADTIVTVQFDASRFDSITQLSLRSFLETAAEQGIPLGPLINRALEGAARKVSGAMIMATVRLHAAALVEARAVLGAATPLDELEAGARALRAGVEPKTLAAIRVSRPVGTATIPLVVLTDIVQRGVPGAAARDAVTTIARMPSSDDALNGLRESVAKNSVRGPGMALDALRRYVQGTVSGARGAAPAATELKPIRPPSP